MAFLSSRPGQEHVTCSNSHNIAGVQTIVDEMYVQSFLEPEFYSVFPLLFPDVDLRPLETVSYNNQQKQQPSVGS